MCMRIYQPRFTFSRLKHGDHVTHTEHGTGKVLGEWGNWFSCRSCLAELPSRTGQCPSCRRVMAHNEVGLQVSGQGVFEVEFEDGMVRSINQDWLRKVRAPL